MRRVFYFVRDRWMRRIYFVSGRAIDRYLPYTAMGRTDFAADDDRVAHGGDVDDFHAPTTATANATSAIIIVVPFLVRSASSSIDATCG